MPRAPLRITVAIPTYNRSRLLRQTLAGIVQQQYPRDAFEILVIDNNSRDDTRTVVAEFTGAHPSLRYVLEEQQGLDHARNRAVAEAKGDILVFGDDDILVEPTWLTLLVAAFSTEESDRIGAVGGEVVPVFPDGLPPWVAEWHSPLAFRETPGPLAPNQSPMGANLAFPSRVFQEFGLFSTTLDRKGSALFSGGETEYLKRLRAGGREIWFAPGARVLHQMPASRTTFRYAARHAFDSARSRVVERGSRSAPYLLSRLFANLAKAVLFGTWALLAALVLRTGDAKKALVRAWRSCGYIYQVPRTLRGKL